MKTTMDLFRMAKNLALILAVLFISISNVLAQSEEGVSIGDTFRVADPSAILELFSATKGFLPPRMTSEERDSIANPAEGLIIFDTDVNQLLYYNDGWKPIGLWIKFGNDVAGRINPVYIIDTTSDASLEDGNFRLVVLGKQGIASVTGGDSLPEGNMSNLFLGNFTNNDYPGYINTVISSDVEGTDSSLAACLSTWISGNGGQTVGMISEAYYTGNSESFEVESPPMVGGVSGLTHVEDPDAVVMATGSFFMSGEDQKGLNIGTFAQASSETTYGNIGGTFTVNSDEGIPMDTFMARFPERITIGMLSVNGEADSADFNIYAAGEAKNYFEGNIGIGTYNPQATLDVVGAVNALAYLVDGDTLALNNVWSQSGDDLYYDHGKVYVGELIPGSTADFNVVGSLLAVSDTTPSLPFSVFAVRRDTVQTSTGLNNFNTPGVSMFIMDTFSQGGNLDTAILGFGIGTDEDGLSSGWSFFSDSLTNLISMSGLSSDDYKGIFIASGTTLSDDNPWYPKTFINVLPANFALYSNSETTASSLLINGATKINNGTALNHTSFIADSLGLQLLSYGNDTTNLTLTQSGVEIGTDTSNTELHVYGGIKQSITTADLSNPPTISDINAAFGSADSRGTGWTGYLKDDDSDYFYQVVSVFNGTTNEWHFFSSTKAGN